MADNGQAAALYWELYRVDHELPGRLLAALQEGRGEGGDPKPPMAQWAAHCLVIAAGVLAHCGGDPQGEGAGAASHL